MTEQLQTPFLVLALTTLALSPHGSRGRMFLSGFSAGMASLARSVSVALLGLMALWKLLSSGFRGGWKPACFLLL